MLSLKLKKKIAWSTTVQIVGKGIQLGLGILSIKLVTQALGPEEYGLYGKISEYALFFSVAANLGIFGNTVRKMSEKPEDGNLFTNFLMLRVITALLIFVLGMGIAFFSVEETAFLWGVGFFLAALLFDYITSVCDGFLQAQYRMGRATLALILGRLVNLGMLVVLIQVGTASGEAAEAPFFFLAPLCAAMVTAGLSLFFVKQKLHFSWKLNGELLKNLLWTGLPFGIINILNSLYFRFIPSYFMAQILHNEAFSFYNLSLHLTTTLSLVSTFAMFSTLPAFKQALLEKKTQKANELFRFLKKIFLFLGVTLVAGGSIVGPWALSLLSGEAFLIPELGFIFSFLLAIAAVSYFYDLVLITLFALEKEWWMLKREGLALGVALLLSLSALALPTTSLQAAGLLLGALIAETLMVLLGLQKIHHTLGNPSPVRTHFAKAKNLLKGSHVGV